MSLLRKIIVQNNLAVSVFRSFQNKILLQEITKLPNIQSVINIGSNQDEKDKEGKLYCHYFPEAKYFTLDKNFPSPHSRHFYSDIHDLSALDYRFDLILLMSVLEHVEKPWLVVEQLLSIMNLGSYLFITVPFFYPIHKDPGQKYGDYWRFTDDGLRVLFSDLKVVWVKSFDSVIVSVEDRDAYWEADRTPSGYAALFQKK